MQRFSFPLPIEEQQDNHTGTETNSAYDCFRKEEPPRNRSATWRRLMLPSGMGVGYIDTFQVHRGVLVRLYDYRFDHSQEGVFPDGRMRLDFRVMLSGQLELFFPGNGTSGRVCQGDLWLIRGDGREIRYLQPGNVPIRGLSVSLPAAMASTWLHEASDGKGRMPEEMVFNSGGRNGMLCGTSSLLRVARARCHESILRCAMRLFDAPRRTVCDELRLESMALDLLSHLFALRFSRDCVTFACGLRQRSAIGTAVDILLAEWADPPTIAELARRVALNECYLKTGFRQRTGYSVGEFVRQLRMRHAIGFIESGCSVLQTALLVGYSNPSHFSAAFNRFHGYLPSVYRAAVQGRGKSLHKRVTPAERASGTVAVGCSCRLTDELALSGALGVIDVAT